MTTASPAQAAKTNAITQSWALSVRAIVRFARQPTSWIPGTIFPLLLVAVNSSAMSRVTMIDSAGFPPGTNFLMFLLPAAIIQGVMFGGINGGAELATDIQTGFFDRMVSSPVSRSSILIGRLGGAMAFAGAQAVLFQLILWPFGADVVAGIPGRLILVAVAVVLALGFGALAAGVAARSGQAEAVQGFFPLVFITLFLSSCFFPTSLMTGWYRAIAEWNPITFMVDGMRHQVMYGLSWSEAAIALGTAAAICVLGLWFAVTGVRRRIESGGV
ncbi:MAG: ABC transporter permease [Actinomycetia bacterium]|nr:ABC transporter permease [Actinomycetes bacterium]